MRDLLHGILSPKYNHPRQSRRAVCGVLALALLLGLLPGLTARAAEAVSIDARPEKETWFQSAVMHEDRLILSSGEGLYEYYPGEETVRVLVPPEPDAMEKLGLPPYPRILGDQERLYALDVNEKGPFLIAITFEGATPHAQKEPLQLAWGKAAERAAAENNLHSPSRAVLMGGQVHLLFMTWGPKGPDRFLLTYDLKEGAQPTLREAENIQQIAAYKDGQLLALIIDEQNSWDEANKRQKVPDLGVMDLADGTVRVLGSTGFPYRHNEDLLYEPQTDTIYMTGNAELLRKVGEGDFEVCAYTDASYGRRMLGGALFPLEPGKVLIAGGQGVSIRTTDPAQLPPVRLNIYGGYLDDAAKQAIREMGSVAVRFLDSQHYPTAQEFGQALLSGEDQIDLFLLDGGYMDMSALQQKGYTLDLSGSQPLTDYAAQLYPELQAAGEQDGKLMMVAVEMYANMFGYHPKVFTAMGLEPPRTFFELCDLIERWNDDLADEHADFTPFRSSDIRGELTFIALQMYADAAALGDKGFQFSDPLLRRMLERVEKLRIDNLGMTVDTESPDAQKAFDELYKKVSMVDMDFDLSLRGIKYMQDAQKYPQIVSSERSGVRMPLLLTADEGVPFNAALWVRMAAVSAKSQHPEAATRYLELYVANLRQEMKAALMPGMDSAIPNPDYERQMENLQRHLKALEAAAAKAEGAEKTELEGSLEKYRKSLVGEEDRRKFIATEEAVKLYRQILEHRYVTRHDSMRMLLNNEDIRNVLQRYQQKQLTLDQFLQEADGKLRLMRLETQ